MTHASSIGIVYLVGAGPGDPGLITVRGLDLVRQADVIVYDYLTNPLLLEHTPPQCEKIYVGKRGRGHRFPQEEINRLLIARARAGKRVVRLKGGDPLVFGRGGEEALILQTENIPFEIVPGVTSGIAAPAYAGIPLTHRDFASDIIFITGHHAPGGDKRNWAAIAQCQGTLVLYMGLAELANIAEHLINHGKDPATPAAVIRWGTLPRQQTLIGTLASIGREVAIHDIKPPALVVIGPVVSLRAKLNWFEQRPLFGKKIVITRSAQQAKETIAQFAAQGAEVIAFPTIEIQALEDLQALDRCLDSLSRYKWLIFTSTNTVDCVFARLHARGRDSRALGTLKVAAIGKKTAARLREFGITADCTPTDSHSEGLLAALHAVGIDQSTVLLPSAETSRPELLQGLHSLACTVDRIPVYRTVRATPPGIDLPALAPDWIIFTSGSTVDHAVALIGQTAMNTMIATGTKLACLGPITQSALIAHGLPCHVVAPEASTESLIRALCSY